MAKTLTPIETFLAPLARLAAKDPDIEGHVFWAANGAWSDEPSEALESEEIAFYAEGLLIEGFQMTWQVIGTADDGADDAAETVLLFIWEGQAVSLPDYGPVLLSGTWPA